MESRHRKEPLQSHPNPYLSGEPHPNPARPHLIQKPHKPRNFLARLPPWLSHWLGYRPPSPSSPPNPKRAEYIIWLWSWIGAFCGIAVIQAVFGQADYFVRRGVPNVVASYGASAVLIYGAIESPLAQPRALIGGHFIGALVGICITKLFELLPTEERYGQLEWLAGSLSCATAIVAMQMTDTTHPPGGATALLAATSTEIRHLGWYYLPIILLTSTLVLVVALIINNIQRRYPVFWITPPKVTLVEPNAAEPVGTAEAYGEMGLSVMEGREGEESNSNSMSQVRQGGEKRKEEKKGEMSETRVVVEEVV
ncbi:hypothetical protein D9758_014829 [Tetrapyrgos nigripes]|uniref:HPP transmembrane region domain-containing protein n=1 Tax=Tetrapyrgos nigripes TaxID=182062 RepID=A0A8H5FET6_9AGAR|nr:hypothetical protein D9758_014829 [Tetrapyrgos nigripes]